MLEKIYEPVNHQLESVRRLIESNLSENDYYREIGNHLKQRQGKHIRSAIILLLNKYFNGNEENAVKLAVSCETMHLASLLHDDVIDNSDIRRGMESINSKFGNKLSILMGDYLYCKAFKNIPEKRDEILSLLLEASEQMCEGEALEMMKSHDTDIKIEDNINIIKLKTASLFRNISICTGKLSNLSDEDNKKLGEFGLNFGLLFQLTDDLLDFTADRDKIGKPVFSDLKEGYYTVPIINILDNPEFSDQLKSILDHESPEDYEEDIKNLMKKSDSISITRNMIKKYRDNAISILENLNKNENSDIRDSLIRLVNFTAERIY